MTGEILPASIVIRSKRLVAEISRHGAELIRLQDRDGKDRQRQHSIRDRDLPAGSKRTIRLILRWQ
jgi:hypothetical protein